MASSLPAVLHGAPLCCGKKIFAAWVWRLLRLQGHSAVEANQVLPGLHTWNLHTHGARNSAR
ncbi:hypothetical protein BRN76_09730 [Xanthomonas oryzae pv. oryzae]|uniref:Uncharacterized protein n=1 Tax=Xanthomonas oryzae pv. oryzae TaxID=64187 RepID=A0A854DTY2_XANOO|nr:hypothetical protein [Xanthomonas oryzae]AXQ10317.1 hypothetical protein BCR61_18395 [Xanthomonas oryzae pv. oryzae]AXQ76248.1 hypothetical protein BXU03_18090 [Xanthomonas oryzae pv. oryzae]AZK87916.1 hypothetical protein BO993_13950 [Xanthomonas oryzae pv. oryzae]OLG33194.1 hypothetical protein BXO2_14685 [Xanthomonas oryzae pv. oryzae]OLG51571.1 hypothetical protein BXO8_03485 [Xanthomonas oryzae pv. oryzae]